MAMRSASARRACTLRLLLRAVLLVGAQLRDGIVC